VVTGPPIMIVGAAVKDLGLPDSADADPTKPYLMWPSTPYAHAMIPVGGSAAHPTPAKATSDMKDKNRDEVTAPSLCGALGRSPTPWASDRPSSAPRAIAASRWRRSGSRQSEIRSLIAVQGGQVDCRPTDLDATGC